MGTQSERYFLIAVAFIASTLFASAQQKEARDIAADAKDKFAKNFQAQHEIGRRFRVDPAELPAPKSSAIVTNRSMTVPYNGQVPQVPPGFTATPFATGLVNPRRLLVLPNGDVLVAEQSAGYLTLLRDDGSGRATWINRHVEDLNRPYGLAWQNDHVLVADQDGIWSVPHVLGALRAGRPENKRADEVPPDERKATPGAYGAKMITKKGVFGIVQGHQNRHLVIDPKTGALFVGVGSSGNHPALQRGRLRSDNICLRHTQPNRARNQSGDRRSLCPGAGAGWPR
jgi:glucose/arabinose dehydrogenase